jgi:hypothetical protein
MADVGAVEPETAHAVLLGEAEQRQFDERLCGRRSIAHSIGGAGDQGKVLEADPAVDDGLGAERDPFALLANPHRA